MARSKTHIAPISEQKDHKLCYIKDRTVHGTAADNNGVLDQRQSSHSTSQIAEACHIACTNDSRLL